MQIPKTKKFLLNGYPYHPVKLNSIQLISV